MLHFFKMHFMNLKIKRKIALGMVSTALVTALVVGILCTVSFVNLYTDRSRSQMDNTLDVTILSLQENINDMYRSTTYLLSNDLFSDIWRSTTRGEKDAHFMDHYSSAQSYFLSYLRSNNLLDGVVLLCSSGDIYSTYQAGLNYSLDEFSEERAQTSISWLPARTNPLSPGGTQVIPVCFPLSYQQETSTQQGISFSNGKNSSMVLVAYLDVDRLALSMEQMNRAAFSRVYLSNPTGLPLSVKESDPMYQKLTDSSFRNRLVNSEKRIHFITDFDGETYSVATEEIGSSGLRIVSAVSYDKMMEDVRKIQEVTLAAVSISFLLALMISAGLSSTITTPIKRLLGQVDNMRAGNYKLKRVTKYNDEMSTLDGALCDMSQTVVEQMENIKRTETLRRKAEMDALTEQVNPHFLYNTLDCIHWEILSGQQKRAAEMMETLGAFLRLSLSHGREFLTLSETMEHTQQYINIMNYRFESQIRFTYTISPDLTTFIVPKMILQPLAENSILHGFGGQQLYPGVRDPAIAVSAYRQDGKIVISVEDNGRGIDTERAAESLQVPPEVSTHIGIYNVYHRLLYCFGTDVEVKFYSIPYYKNVVTLIFTGENPDL
jgi:two-component system, sensor histidine kinase YesM